MIEIAYISKAAPSLEPGEVFRIIEASARNNARDGLTGVLIFSGGRFFQILEGPADGIEALLARLGKDGRHDDLTILSRTDIEARSFPKWHMKRLRPGPQLLAGFGTDPVFAAMPERLRALAHDFLGSSGDLAA